jgi:ribonucleoside-diphosphate reductase alpha chain
MSVEFGYRSTFEASSNAHNLLSTGGILYKGESPTEMMERVVGALSLQEEVYDGRASAITFASKLGLQMDTGKIAMSTPILTNAGTEFGRPLSACTMPTLSLVDGNRRLITEEIDQLHQQGMGTGFNLSDTHDPIATLNFLNGIATEGAASGLENRPVGNMGILSVYHPSIIEFINCKRDSPKNTKWKFNISVDLDRAFFTKLENGDDITLLDGKSISSRLIFSTICDAATECADPGLVFLDRMNERNPVPAIGAYKTTAPCAEVGLVEGESCQFGYLNIASFLVERDGEVSIDYASLSDSTHLLTRALDNALGISINNFLTPRSVYVTEQKRKIGIGICGLADAFSISSMAYDSPEARRFAKDILAHINFQSKLASVDLADSRGSAMSMLNLDPKGNLHLSSPGHIQSLYAQLSDTAYVKSSDWVNLANEVRRTKKLRNTSTIALPPTGRSALVIDASAGIEPHFSMKTANTKVLEATQKALRNSGGNSIHSEARQISPMGHIAMAAELQTFTDEAISKTVNMPSGTTPSEVEAVYLKAYYSGMSGVTVYVDGSHRLQPLALK